MLFILVCVLIFVCVPLHVAANDVYRRKIYVDNFCDTYMYASMYTCTYVYLNMYACI